jgi:hypothetical protein
LRETDLGRPFRLVLAFDQRSLDLPADARLTKINLVRQLINRYYKGRAPAAKRAALEQLAKTSGQPSAGT